MTPGEAVLEIINSAEPEDKKVHLFKRRTAFDYGLVLDFLDELLADKSLSKTKVNTILDDRIAAEKIWDWASTPSKDLDMRQALTKYYEFSIPDMSVYEED